MVYSISEAESEMTSITRPSIEDSGETMMQCEDACILMVVADAINPVIINGQSDKSNEKKQEESTVNTSDIITQTDRDGKAVSKVCCCVAQSLRNHLTGTSS